MAKKRLPTKGFFQGGWEWWGTGLVNGWWPGDIEAAMQCKYWRNSFKSAFFQSFVAIYAVLVQILAKHSFIFCRTSTQMCQTWLIWSPIHSHQSLIPIFTSTNSCLAHKARICLKTKKMHWLRLIVLVLAYGGGVGVGVVLKCVQPLVIFLLYCYLEPILHDQK